MTKIDSTESDGCLVRRVRSGDREAFALLVSRYQQGIHKLCFTYVEQTEDAQDVTQDAFVCAFQRLGQLASPERFFFWLRQIATNLCLIRLRQRRGTTAFPDALSEPDTTANIADDLCIRTALDKLGPVTRAMLLLFAEGHSYADIAQASGVPITTVRSRLRDTRARLRKELQMNDEQPEPLPTDFGARVLQEIETSGDVHCVALSPDGHLLATIAQRFPVEPDGNRESEIQIWIAVSGLPLARLVVSSWVSDIVWQRDSRAVLFGCGTIARNHDNGYPSRVCRWEWDNDATQLQTLLELKDGPIFALAVSPKGDRIAVASANWREHIEQSKPSCGITSVYALADKELSFLCSVSHGEQAWAVQFAPDGQLLATGAGWKSENKVDGVWDQGDVRCWNAQTGECLAVLPRPRARAQSAIAFSPDNTLLATGDGPEGDTLVYETQTGVLRHTLRGHNKNVYAVDFSPDGKTLATGSRDSTVRLWDVATGNALRTLREHETAIHAVQFAPDGKTLVSADTQRGCVKVWHLG